MSETATATVIGPWRMDGEGYVRWRGTGFIVFRVDENGTIQLWDRWARDENGKRKPSERPMSMQDIQEFVWCATGGEGEP